MGTLGSFYGIIRLDQPGTGTYGWQVRLQRGGVRHARYFPDRASGGSQQSLAAAVAWRDELLANLADERQTRVCATSARNSSGVIGVSRVIIRSGDGVEYLFWQASWTPVQGRRQSIRFSVRRHGDEAAFQLAVAARRQATGL
ncbi:MAG: hypothetical protein CFE26_02465 [Verrucomicrobiales bacterium VVV1]|nr:MAG: hypothetical protein CFE26_02465 [Verrucomicrobiales bacterium VVV1]